MQSGDVIAGKYRLNQPIGSGGMASVWSATNVFTERQLAIKFMHPSVARTPEAARRFLMEAKVSARINHPNIIDILDVGQAEDGAFFLVMELLQGVSLETAMRRQAPPMLVFEFVGVMIDVARALTAAHRSGVVHRDLKPSNIFLHMIRESVAVPKLLDFGVSKFLEDQQNNELTLAGTVLGSPLYMSPEQAQGDEGIDGRTDVFAFGAILFEAMCGYRAYDAPNFNALIVMVATKQPKSIDEAAPQMPESLREVVRDCLATDREKRIPTFGDVVDRLIAVLPDLESSGLRLPVHRAHADPEATNALPVLRPSDRPTEAQAERGVHLSSPPPFSQVSQANAPGAFSSPWSSGDRHAITISRRPSTLLFGAGAATAALVVGLVLWIDRDHDPSPTKPATAVSAAPPLPVVIVPTQAPSVPPIIEVDSLPLATVRAPVGHATGRISVASSPAWCNLAIDGTSRGPTPIASIEVSAGPHLLVCTPETGKPKTMTVNVAEGSANRFKIELE